MRRKMRSVMAVVAIAAATAFGGQAAFAHQADAKPGCQEHQGMHRKGAHFKETLKKLGLTDQQKAQVREQFQGGKPQMKEMFKALMTEKQKLHALVASGSADEHAIRAQAARVAAVEADLAVRKAQQMRSFLAILTPEQAAKFKEIQAQRQERMKKFMMDKEKGGKHHHDHDPFEE